MRDKKGNYVYKLVKKPLKFDKKTRKKIGKLNL